MKTVAIYRVIAGRNYVSNMWANKSLKVVPRCASSLDSFSLGMLRILRPALRCPLALR